MRLVSLLRREAAVSSAPGMTVYIDPRTGGPLPGQAPSCVRLSATPGDAERSQHIRSRPSGGPELRAGQRCHSLPPGAFPEPLFAITDANGKVKIQHLHEIPGTDDKK